MTRSLLLLACLLPLVSVRPAAAQDPSPDLPLSNPFYSLLDRFEARGWFKAPLTQARPITRRQAAGLLLQILRRGPAGLSRTEQALLKRYRAEFAVELAALGYHAAPETPAGVWNRLSRGDDLYAWRDSVASVAMDPLFRERVIQMNGAAAPHQSVSQTYVGGILRGTFHNHLGFRIRHYEAREWSTLARHSRQDVLERPLADVEIKGKAVDFRDATLQLVIATPWFDVDVGKGSMDWGPGRTGNLLLTDYAPSYGMIRLRAAYGRVRLIHVAGFLRARPGLIDSSRTQVDNGHVRTFLRSKYLAAHRLEIVLSRRVLLGLQESVVYGDQPPQLLYLTPVTLFAAAQTYLGNHDNLTVGFDLTAQPASGLEVYWAMFFDDMVKFNLGAFANKYALQLGTFWVDPLHLSDTDLRLEFVHIEPFVYSHNFNINTYENYDTVLGYPLGPNSDRLYARLDHRFSPALSVDLSVARDRHGANPVAPDGTITNVGGNAELGRRPTDPAVRKFLAGILETRLHLTAGLRWEPVRHTVFSFDYERTAGKNIPLPGGGRGNAVGTTWTLTTDFNFF